MFRLTAFRVCLLAALLLPLGCVEDEPTGPRVLPRPTLDVAPPLVPGTRIAFVREQDENHEIYVMNADGSGQTNLTDNAAVDHSPAWSPDGSKIAFFSDRDESPGVYVMNSDGSNPQLVIADAGRPAWSPDGTKIAFQRWISGYNHDIFVANADGSNELQLTTDTGTDQHPTWSPDGSRIAFSSNRDGGDDEIFVMDSDGSDQTQLTSNAADDGAPEWSPDGGKIVFVSDRDDGWEIYVMNPDGSGQTNLTDDAGGVFPTWSPDGSRIAFRTSRDLDNEIYVMNADGSEPTNITNYPTAADMDPSWGLGEGSAGVVFVTNTNDSGAGSLRQAIFDANAEIRPDYVVFAIPGAGPHTIYPETDLPEITDTLVLDGYTQAGAVEATATTPATLMIVLDGGETSESGGGLMVSTNASVIRGLAIQNFPGAGIGVNGHTNRVEGNHILYNEADGIYITGSDHTIGGSTPEKRNVISGNDIAAIAITPGSSWNYILGNFVGTDPTGTDDLANLDGIGVGGKYNHVGGVNPGEGNLVSGNLNNGILIERWSASDTMPEGNVVQGNRVGTDITGTYGIPNGQGVSINCARNNTVGGSAPGAANLIAYNLDNGVLTFDGGDACSVGDATGNLVSRNSIHSNGTLSGALGIDHFGDGVTPNDPGDYDTGPNNLQNYPVLTSAVIIEGEGDVLVVTGTIDTQNPELVTLEFFANDEDDPSGHGEGQTFLGTAEPNTAGDFTAYLDLVEEVTSVTATATDDNYNTSEFAANLGVSEGGVITVTVTGSVVAGYVVTVVNDEKGPFRLDETMTMAVTDEYGQATIGGLTLPGHYCVHVRPLVSVWDATAFGTLYVPPPTSEYEPQQSGDRAGGIYDGSETVDLTLTNYRDYCLDGPIPLDEEDSEASIYMELQGASHAASVEVTFLYPDGTASGSPGWVVSQLDREEVPWFIDEEHGEDVYPGLLHTAAPEVGGLVTLTGLAPGEEVIVQSGIIEGPSGEGSLTYTTTVTTPGEGEVEQVEAVLEPLMCAVELKDEAAGDSRRAIDFLGPVKDGRRAELVDDELEALNELGIYYDQVGNGDAKLHMMFEQQGEWLNLVAHYRCRNGSCTLQRVNGTALDVGITVSAFFASQGDGTVRVTWSIEGLPADITQVRYKLTTVATGDAFPDAGMTPVNLDDYCTGGTSNDPRWHIPM